MNRIIGALWKREKGDKTYMSGVLQDFHGDVNIAVFPNNYKEKDNQPDYNIVISFPDKKQVEKHENQIELVEPEKKNGRKKKEEVEKPPF